MFNKEECAQLMELVGRATLKGTEVEAAAVLIHKLRMEINRQDGTAQEAYSEEQESKAKDQ